MTACKHYETPRTARDVWNGRASLSRALRTQKLLTLLTSICIHCFLGLYSSYRDADLNCEGHPSQVSSLCLRFVASQRWNLCMRSNWMWRLCTSPDHCTSLLHSGHAPLKKKKRKELYSWTPSTFKIDFYIHTQIVNHIFVKCQNN